ncbi:hypothetical protein G6O69_31900 [Pseudenhygromyxa sp. WMMC2535]|uniref:Ig-like domain-containing protein n=1 Tax=Pseudenhygromyxa sp. WMMC2535 TaxID=2712867 RepID=UPI0015528B28|nr:Ig-like domain-containing protein [Pseudenhygromyxa sp. WMMC2535]NVB42471.1 hypothetical protein [Pseudenhygromyxa sp. WMMC2535]
MDPSEPSFERTACPSRPALGARGPARPEGGPAAFADSGARRRDVGGARLGLARVGLARLGLGALAIAGASAGCVDAPRVDLDGPQVVASALDDAPVEVSVLPELWVELDEALDPDSIHAGAVAVVPWEVVGDCSLSLLCEEGQCARGRCWVEALSSSDRRALDAGTFAGGVALSFALGDGGSDGRGEGARLSVRPLRPLAAHTRYSLVLGAAVRDRSGAALGGPGGEPQAWARDFVTAAAGSAGPEPQLVQPAPGQRGVPTNLAWVDLAVFPPVPLPQAEAELILEAEDGGPPARLGEASTCPGWVPGTCLRTRPLAPLRPQTRYRPAGGSLVDAAGRSALTPAAERETWFETGAGEDLELPAPALSSGLRGRCVVIALDSAEPLELELAVEGAVRRGSVAAPGGLIGLAAAARSEGEAVPWTLSVRDLAGNAAAFSGALTAGASFDPELPAVDITEVLANPAGPEPDAEFVELRLSPDAAGPAELGGLVLSDLDPASLATLYAAGETIPGDTLPALSLAPGELALLVSSGWAPGLGEDPAPPAGAAILVLDASLASGGLKNAGEALSLWRPGPAGPQLVASYGDWIDTGASAHNGRSVVGEGGGCDLPDRWRAHPQGRSGPGLLP